LSPHSQVSRRARAGRVLKSEKIYRTRIVALAKVLIDEVLRGRGEAGAIQDNS
jgi:hypothetical protein